MKSSADSDTALSFDSDNTVAGPNNHRRIAAGKVDLLLAQMPAVLAGNYIVSAVVVFILDGAIDPFRLWGWLGLVYLLTTLRGWATWRFRSLGPTLVPDANMKTVVLAAFSGLSGVVWGSGGILFIRLDDPVYTAFIILLLAGMSAASLASLSPRPMVYWSYSVPTMLPVAIYLETSSTQTIPHIGLLIGMFLAVNVAYSIVLSRSYAKVLELRFENLSLLDRLSEQKKLAEQANTAKSRFLAAASHDLRQPLHALELFLSSLDHSLDRDEQRYLLRRARQSSDVLGKLLSALLDISKFDAGAIQPEFRHIPLARVLDPLRSELEPIAAHKGLRLVVHDSTYVILTDEVLLLRLLQNLTANAVQHTSSGWVLVGARYRQDRLRIDVCDTGPGIPNKEREKIFAEYYQLQNPERDREKGLGLGLAIAQRLSTLLDHPISLDTRPGRGSRFSVEVPVGRRMQVTDAGSKLKSVSADPGGASALVIDDETAIREGMSRLLKGWGMTVRVAANRAEAIAVVEDDEFNPTIVICDFRLPQGDNGIEIVAQLRSLAARELPALLISGDTAPERLREARAAAIPLLQKPLSSVSLRNAIVRALDGA